MPCVVLKVLYPTAKQCKASFSFDKSRYDAHGNSQTLKNMNILFYKKKLFYYEKELVDWIGELLGDIFV